MTVLEGKGVCEGYASGKIVFYKNEEYRINKINIEDVNAELSRFWAAKDTAIRQLMSLYDSAVTKVGEDNAQIFSIHQMMLEDSDYSDSIINIISDQKTNAEYAVATTSDNFAQIFSSMDDEYMNSRAEDVRDISNRIIKILTNSESASLLLHEPSILAAEDLTPSETIQLDKSKILALVTMRGSGTSHTAILARSMNIPAIVGLGSALDHTVDGKSAIVDGFTGTVYTEPDIDITTMYTTKMEIENEKRLKLSELKGKENVTLDGQKIDIFANVGSVEDAITAFDNDAGGIGLFRSEFLYLQAKEYPSEDEQFQSYKSVVEKMANKKVIIRTLDIGADKQIDYFKLDKEENPAMGFRGIRICLERKDIFRTQLRAIYRASAFGNVAIMFPMITDTSEIRDVKEIVTQVKDKLREEKVSFSDDVELGVMIETPAAVMVSDLLAKEVDFFSVGTNDLTQYTLAVDRQNAKLDRYYQPHHKGILRMLKIIVDNAHNEGIWVGICGEIASETDMTETFLAMGIDELSVSPQKILAVREKVRSIDVSKVKQAILDGL